MSIKIALLRSSNPFEHRVPIHPVHIPKIDPSIRNFLFFEENYYPTYDNSYYTDLGCNIESRNNLIRSADCTLIVKPVVNDLLQMKKDATVLGWFHCVQQQDIVKAAITNKLTLICMESLFHEDGTYFFNENSRITGKCGVMHALSISQLAYNKNTHVAIIGHGNVAIGAIEQLQSMGINSITCYSKRTPDKIINRSAGIKFKQISYPDKNGNVYVVDNNNIFYRELIKTDVVINACAQDIYHPAIYIKTCDLLLLKSNTLIIDMSCDKAMGFEFATITTFANPIIKINNNILFYAIDHLPTLEYDIASVAISNKLLLIILPLVKQLTISGYYSNVITNAIQVKQGMILNPDITYFGKAFPQRLRMHLNPVSYNFNGLESSM